MMLFCLSVLSLSLSLSQSEPPVNPPPHAQPANAPTLTWVGKHAVGSRTEAKVEAALPDWDRIMGPDHSRADTSIPNFECITVESGCPANSRLIDASGNYGCNPDCTGNCYTCEGTPSGSYNVCSKRPDKICVLVVHQIACGKKGKGSCGSTTSGPPDNMGCYCTPPSTYTGNILCRFVECAPEQ